LTEVRQDVLYISYPQVYLFLYDIIEDMKRTVLVGFITFLTLVPSFSFAQLDTSSSTEEIIQEEIYIAPEKSKSEKIQDEFKTKDSFLASDNATEIFIEPVEIVNDSTIIVRVKAEKNSEPIGFGQKGNIETEKFRIHNAPILVPDGTTTYACSDRPPSACFEKNNYYEDPKEALYQILEDAIRITGKQGTQIESGSFGQTTDIFYPSHDGLIYKGNNTDWATTRSSATGQEARNTVDNDTYPAVGNDAGSVLIGRGFYVFDTSAIQDTDTIDSATMSLFYAGSKDNDDNDGKDYIVFVSNSQSASSTLTTSDFPNIGSVAFSDTIDIGSVSASQYYDWTLNATGLAVINKTGYSYLATREGHDMENEAFVGGSNTFNYVNWYFSQHTGTTNDPKLTVIHSATPEPPASTSSNIVIHRTEQGLTAILVLIMAGIAGYLIWNRNNE